MHEELRARVIGVEAGYPYIPAPAYTTARGTRYLMQSYARLGVVSA